MQQLQEQINKLSNELAMLSQQFYKNNFSGSQVFSKDLICQTRLKVPHYESATIGSGAPSVCEVGDLIEVGGKLYICTVANTTFTLVGSQS